MSEIKKVIDLISIKDGHLLIVKKKNIWILPGGTLENGESELECLMRELTEELHGLFIRNTRRHKTYEGISPHQRDKIEVCTYFADVCGEIITANEISDAQYVSNFNGFNLSEVLVEIIESLKKDNFL